ncbi:MAG: hypothetical protein JNJ90_01790 [Saprospiraceae bacterium]|jgi:hypothetical protein|nr:hypothetical protein [Saprospiraceae bacterium]
MFQKDHFLPFARPDYVEGMIIGNDLDSLLSAAYLHQRFGWPVSGVYCGYSRLWHTRDATSFRQKLLSGKLFAVDLDICIGTVPSLGHHIIQLDAAEVLPGHTHTLNPNVLAGRSVRQGFHRKYPLATIHLLLHIFSENDLARRAAPLVWLADSAFINAQHYRENVEAWIRAHMRLPAFEAVLPTLQTLEFEQHLRDTMLTPLSGNSLCRPAHNSRYCSKHLGLNGYQAQFDNPNDPRIRNLSEEISRLAGWPELPLPERFEGYLQGRRNNISVQELLNSGQSFDTWLERNDVFSYAFVFKDRLNYTSGIG